MGEAIVVHEVAVVNLGPFEVGLAELVLHVLAERNVGHICCCSEFSSLVANQRQTEWKKDLLSRSRCAPNALDETFSELGGSGSLDKVCLRLCGRLGDYEHGRDDGVNLVLFENGSDGGDVIVVDLDFFLVLGRSSGQDDVIMARVIGQGLGNSGSQVSMTTSDCDFDRVDELVDGRGSGCSVKDVIVAAVVRRLDQRASILINRFVFLLVSIFADMIQSSSYEAAHKAS